MNILPVRFGNFLIKTPYEKAKDVAIYMRDSGRETWEFDNATRIRYEEDKIDLMSKVNFPVLPEKTGRKMDMVA